MAYLGTVFVEKSDKAIDVSLREWLFATKNTNLPLSSDWNEDLRTLSY